MERRITRQIKIGSVAIGGNNPIALQSMTNARDYDGILEQMLALQNAGCDIVRLAVPDMDTVRILGRLKENVAMPIVADIHFDYRLALESAHAGVDKIRINPGNIGDLDRIKAVANICAQKGLPIRIGVNGGSLESDILQKYGEVSADALMASAVKNIQLLEKFDFDNIVVSIKSSSVPMMMAANQIFSEKYDYPLHLGVTEAGTLKSGTIKGAVGIGGLLAGGIGDTIRVSLTAPVVEEIHSGREILKASGRYHGGGVEIISCPTCARASVDIIAIANELEMQIEHNLPHTTRGKLLKVAVMGCAVNGPGEAREADLGVACGNGEGLLFSKGRPTHKVLESEIVSALMQEISLLQ